MTRQDQMEAQLRRKPKRLIHSQRLIQALYACVIIGCFALIPIAIITIQLRLAGVVLVSTLFSFPIYATVAIIVKWSNKKNNETS